MTTCFHAQPVVPTPSAPARREGSRVLGIDAGKRDVGYVGRRLQGIGTNGDGNGMGRVEAHRPQ